MATPDAPRRGPDPAHGAGVQLAGASRGDGQFRRNVAIALLCLGVYLLLAITGRTVLFADGAFYLTWILEHQRPMDFDSGRHFAHLVTQVPAVLALRLGVSDLKLLTGLFALGLWVPFAIGFWICRRAAGLRQELVLFPLVSFFAVTANSSFVIVSESHLVVSLFWALLLVLAVPRPWSGWWLALAVGLGLPLLRSYESMVLLGPILAIAASWRAAVTHSRSLRLGAAAVAVWCLAGTTVAAYWTLFPRVPFNRQAFTGALLPLRDHLGHMHGFILLSLSALVLMGIAAVRGRARVLTLGIAVFLLAAIALSLQPLLRPATVAPLLHYHARTLNLSLTLALTAAFAFTLRWGCNVPLVRWAHASSVLLILAAAQTTWFAFATWHWIGYFSLVRREVSSASGLRAFEETRLGQPLVDGHPAATMNWGWTMPTLSILVAPGGVVRAIIANPLAERGWQPFDPRNPDSLPRLQHYGVDYGAYLAALRGP